MASVPSTVEKEEELEDHNDEAAPTLPIKAMLVNFGQGMYDSVNLTHCLKFVFKSPKIRNLCINCFILNGVVLCGSLCVYWWVLKFAWRFDTSGSNFVDWILDLLFNVIWMYPLKILAQVLNTIWYTYIFDEAVKISEKGKGKVAPTSFNKVIRGITDEVYKMLLLLVYIIQAMVLPELLPLSLGYALSFVLFCWLHSFFTFDYRWGARSWSLHKKMEHFHASWDYYLGFGTPMMALFSGLSYKYDTFVGFGLTSLLFPFHIILSLCLDTTSVKSTRIQSHGHSLPIFSSCRFVLDGVIQLIRGRRLKAKE